MDHMHVQCPGRCWSGRWGGRWTCHWLQRRYWCSSARTYAAAFLVFIILLHAESTKSGPHNIFESRLHDQTSFLMLGCTWAAMCTTVHEEASIQWLGFLVQTWKAQNKQGRDWAIKARELLYEVASRSSLFFQPGSLLAPPSVWKAVIKLAAHAASLEGFSSRDPIGCKHCLTVRSKNHQKIWKSQNNRFA